MGIQDKERRRKEGKEERKEDREVKRWNKIERQRLE